MRYKRAAFTAGVVVGFIAGSRAGREPYNQIVKYSKKALQSPAGRRAKAAASARVSELTRSVTAKAADLTKSAAAQAPTAARKAAGTARDQVGRMSIPKVPGPWSGRAGAAHPDPAAAVVPPSVNGNTHVPRD